ncbi:hypothetical protein ACIRG4_11395 [Streptomyces sp. NPDC102395]|uniref:hypothetical protein n=1 Tax=Streptomyces sp. NPDC102395 TaxID=3366168 RepID=UPI003816BBA6
MTGNHKDKTLTRHRALAVTGGTVAAGGLAVAGCRTAFADTTRSAVASTSAATSTSASNTASTSASSSSSCMKLMSSVTEGPYYLDGALVRKNISEGKGGVPLTLRLAVVDATDGCTPVACHIPLKAHTGGQKPVKKADPARGYKGFLTLRVDPDAENTGAGGGAGGAGGMPPTGTPPSGAPTGTPPSGAPSTSASS